MNMNLQMKKVVEKKITTFFVLYNGGKMEW